MEGPEEAHQHLEIDCILFNEIVLISSKLSQTDQKAKPLAAVIAVKVAHRLIRAMVQSFPPHRYAILDHLYREMNGCPCLMFSLLRYLCGNEDNLFPVIVSAL